MILMTFGWLTIGSLFILAGWFRQGWRHRYPVSFYNAALVMTVGMDIHALGFALQLTGRIQQILFDGAGFETASPIYWLGMALIFTGKTLFVWLAALGEGRSYSKLFIWSYWAALAAWAAFSAWWYL
jgi:hypothetical protein